MKPTAGYAKPRRMTAGSHPTKLNLQRRPRPEPEDEITGEQQGGFWKWVLLIALLHVFVIVGASLFYLFQSSPPPPPQFISLLPPGDVVKGSPGAQQAHKVGAKSQAAPSHHAAPPLPATSHATPPQPQPKPVTPPPVAKPPSPTPIVKETAPSPLKPAPAKPKIEKPKLEKPKPVKPKVKVDLHEVDRTDAPDTPTPPKPAKHHAKKPVQKPDDAQDDADSTPDNTGLTKQQIAEKLGDKLDPSGTHNAQKYGDSGAPGGHENNFQDFYNMIGNQIRDEWNSPMTPASIEPVVGMHVERDGHVTPGSVHLIRSSGDPAYDQAALDTVSRLGYLHEPLPDGCPPDIKISFNPNS